MIRSEMMEKLEERFQRDLQTGHRDIGINYTNGLEEHYLRTAWMLVPCEDTNKFLIFEQFTGHDNKPGYRLGYYIENDNGGWSRPTANPMFSMYEWTRLINILIRSDMMDGRVAAMFG